MHRTYRLLLFAVLLGVLSPALAGRDFLIDADWLAEHIDDGNLVVLEVRYHPHRYFTVGHIPGAVQVQRFKDLGDNAASPLMRAGGSMTARPWSSMTTPAPRSPRACITCWPSTGSTWSG